MLLWELLVHRWLWQYHSASRLDNDSRRFGSRCNHLKNVNVCIDNETRCIFLVPSVLDILSHIIPRFILPSPKTKKLSAVLYLVSGRMRLAVNDRCFAFPFIPLNLAELACLAIKGYKWNRWRERSQNPMKLYWAFKIGESSPILEIFRDTCVVFLC